MEADWWPRLCGKMGYDWPGVSWYKGCPLGGQVFINIPIISLIQLHHPNFIRKKHIQCFRLFSVFSVDLPQNHIESPRITLERLLSRSLSCKVWTLRMCFFLMLLMSYQNPTGFFNIGQALDGPYMASLGSSTKENSQPVPSLVTLVERILKQHASRGQGGQHRGCRGNFYPHGRPQGYSSGGYLGASSWLLLTSFPIGGSINQPVISHGHGNGHSVSRVPLTPCTHFDDHGHEFACDNCHQLYPSYVQVQVRMEVNHHHSEKFQDLFLKDQIWAAHEIWKLRVKNVEMTVFQEAMLEQGLVEYAEPGDAAPDEVTVPLAYAVVIAGECLEMIDNLKEEVVHNDLMVGQQQFFPLVEGWLFPLIALAGVLGPAVPEWVRGEDPQGALCSGLLVGGGIPQWPMETWEVPWADGGVGGLFGKVGSSWGCGPHLGGGQGWSWGSDHLGGRDSSSQVSGPAVGEVVVELSWWEGFGGAPCGDNVRVGVSDWK